MSNSQTPVMATRDDAIRKLAGRPIPVVPLDSGVIITDGAIITAPAHSPYDSGVWIVGDEVHVSGAALTSLK